MPQGDADRVREYATGLVEQARRESKDRIAIRAGDVHDALRLRQAHANVAQALEGDTFHRQANVELVDYRGVKSRRGANSVFVFSIQTGYKPASAWIKRISELPTERGQASDWRKRISELPTERGQASDWRARIREFPTQHEQADDWRKQVLELPIEGFQELFSDYLKAKGFSNAEVEIVIRTRGRG